MAISPTIKTTHASPHTAAEEEPGTYINIIEELHKNTNFTLILWSEEHSQ